MTVDRKTPDYQRGRVTLLGFCRPHRLKMFKSVTIMSALFEHTMTYAVWSTLRVNFIRSETIKVDQPITLFGKRRLRIFTLFHDGWSKRAHDRSGGSERCPS